MKVGVIKDFMRKNLNIDCFNIHLFTDQDDWWETSVSWDSGNEPNIVCGIGKTQEKALDRLIEILKLEART